MPWCFAYRLFDKNKFADINCNLSLLTNLMVVPQRTNSILKLTAFMDEQHFAKAKIIDLKLSFDDDISKPSYK